MHLLSLKLLKSSLVLFIVLISDFFAGPQQCSCNKSNHKEEFGQISKSSWQRNQDFKGNEKLETKEILNGVFLQELTELHHDNVVALLDCKVRNKENHPE